MISLSRQPAGSEQEGGPLGLAPLALRTRDRDAAHSHMSRVLTSHALTMDGDRSELDFRHRGGAVAGLTLHRVHYGPSVSLCVPALERFYLLQVTLSGQCTIGLPRGEIGLSAGHLAVLGPTQGYSKHWGARTDQLMLRIERVMLERALAAELGCDILRPITFADAPVALADAPALAALINLLATLCTRDAPPIHPKIAAGLNRALLSALLYDLAHDRRALLDGPVCAAAPRYVRAAEEFIAAHYADTIDLEDIARAARVSARTLHTGFRRFRDVSPIEHLRAVRLDRARTQLLRARVDGKSVTTVAEESGFRHLGRFAQDYARRFGERPSETLLRRR